MDHYYYYFCFNLFHVNTMTAPPRFTMTPEDVVYVSLGDPIILSCLAEGTPIPEILWYRDNELVHTSPSLAVANDGTELRISSIRQEDIGDYTCAAKNGQGSVRHTTKLVVAGTVFIFLNSCLPPNLSTDPKFLSGKNKRSKVQLVIDPVSTNVCDIININSDG